MTFRFDPPKPTPCRHCGALAIGGVCDACMRAIELSEKAEARAALLRPARGSLPVRGRCMRFGEGILSVWAPAAAIEAAAGWDCTPPVLVLTGPAASGKTSIACALVNRLVDRAAKADASETLVAMAADTYFTAAYWPAKARAEAALGKGEAPIVDRCIGATLLVLDDLGAEIARSSAVPEILFERHHHQRPTIVTTKLTSRAIAERYHAFDGEGLARRLLEAGSSWHVSCGKIS